MNYDALTGAYFRTQADRVLQTKDRLNDRAAAAPGRVVPGEGDLVIGTGRQLQMAVMFLDISGFSKRPSEWRWEQESLLAVLNLFFTEMIRIVEDYGGTVEKNTGDGLMAYFEDGGGDPPESGAKRATACALTMMRANDYLISPILTSSGIEAIRFRVGIDYGPVTVARLGAPRRFNANVAVGTTANIASSTLNLAAPGEIVLGERARNEIPLLWKVLWTEFLTAKTGWEYRVSNAPYCFYRYTARWKDLS